MNILTTVVVISLILLMLSITFSLVFDMYHSTMRRTRLIKYKQRLKSVFLLYQINDDYMSFVIGVYSSKEKAADAMLFFQTCNDIEYMYSIEEEIIRD